MDVIKIPLQRIKNVLASGKGLHWRLTIVLSGNATRSIWPDLLIVPCNTSARYKIEITNSLGIQIAQKVVLPGLRCPTPLSKLILSGAAYTVFGDLRSLPLARRVRRLLVSADAIFIRLDFDLKLMLYTLPDLA